MMRIYLVRALALLCLMAVSPNLSWAERYHDVKQWEGNYRGFIDGRPATLRIVFGTSRGGCLDEVRDKKPGAYIFVVMRDLDRGVVWTRCLNQFGGDAPKDHRWENLVLLNKKTGEKDTVGTFYLHTWDTDVISGWNKWHGKRYGRFFISEERNLPPCEVFPATGYISGAPVMPRKEPSCRFK